VLSADGVIAQPNRLRSGGLECTLSAHAQRARVRLGCWGLTQSGLASSMSMMGIPSSTA
jgi:hypothetical protein